MIVKFFNIAADVREIKESQDWHSVREIVSQLDELDKQSLESSSVLPSLDDYDTHIRVLVALGNKEEAKRLLTLYENGLITFLTKEKRLSDPAFVIRQVKGKIAPLAQLLGEEE